MIYSNPIFETDSKAIAGFLSTKSMEVAESLVALSLYSPNCEFVQQICFAILERNDIDANSMRLAILGLGHTERRSRVIDIDRLAKILPCLDQEIYQDGIENLLADLLLNPKYRKEVKKIARGLKIQI